VLGAGGSARAAVWALLSAGAAEVRVWNRTPARARALCAQLGAVLADEIGPADLLVNCTPAGMSGHSELKSITRPADEIAMFRCVIDFVYGLDETPLIHAARQAGLPAVDGLELLVAQGALSFERFTGQPAPVEAMRAAVSHHG
jgi:shikimate dehydrogenase